MSPRPTNHQANEPPLSPTHFPAWQQLLAGQAIAVRHQLASSSSEPLQLSAAQIIQNFPASSPVPALLPGSFNPLHAGHQQMRQLAAELLGCEVHFELAITNVDKPSLNVEEMAKRLRIIQAGVGAEAAQLWFTRAATFVEKSQLFPAAVFVVGADTAVRLGDLRYYGGDENLRDQAIRIIAERGCRFLVFGRMLDSRFVELDKLELPAGLAQLCQGVPARDFRSDISSTALRQP